MSNQQPPHSPPQKFIARFEDKIIHNDKYIEYHFELVQPHRLKFKAGQYLSLKISDRGERRSYSICSSPLVEHGFEFLNDISPRGIGTNFLENLTFGDQVEVLGPMGNFTIKTVETEQALIMIATGSGITPFKSMLLELLQDQHDQRSITLYWGMRFIQELFWQNDFLDLAQAFPNFKFHPVISKASDEWPLCRGRVTDCLSIHEFNHDAGYYLCGNSSMINDVNKVLIDKGVNQEHIHFEKFY